LAALSKGGAMRKAYSTGIFVFFGFVATTAIAQDLPDNYAVMPGGKQWAVGEGLVPSNLALNPPLPCVQGTERRLPGVGWDKVELKIRVISDYASLLEAENLSVEAFAQTPTYDFHAKYAAQRKLVKNSRNVSIVVEAHVCDSHRQSAAYSLRG
jgi:hypothetical protein